MFPQLAATRLVRVRDLVGHKSIQLTADVCGRFIPAGERTAAQPSATPAQPEGIVEPLKPRKVLVTLTFTSWNQIVSFLRRIDQLRAAA
jgi:hypothetical protein